MNENTQWKLDVNIFTIVWWNISFLMLELNRCVGGFLECDSHELMLSWLTFIQLRIIHSKIMLLKIVLRSSCYWWNVQENFLHSIYHLILINEEQLACLLSSIFAIFLFTEWQIFSEKLLFFLESIIFVILRQDLWTKQKMCESQQDSPFNSNNNMNTSAK